jgi:spoIIIJ-associated protein
MLDRNNLDKIKKEVDDFLKMMTIDIESEYLQQKDDTVYIDIKMKEPQVLIGEGGQTLLDFQHLLAAILRKKIAAPDPLRSRSETSEPRLGRREGSFYIDLDINDYKKKKIEYLKELARSVADEVALDKKEKILPAMPAYERRIIHMELAERGNITTESIGKEPERRIVIKPYP